MNPSPKTCRPPGWTMLLARGGGERRTPGEIGKYRVVQQLGEGGQAAVYRAIHPTLQRDVAIKLSHTVLQSGRPECDRLLAEGRILAELEHPDLLKVYDVDFHQGRPFLVSELVRGRPLDRFVEEASLSPLAAAQMTARVARALAVCALLRHRSSGRQAEQHPHRRGRPAETHRLRARPARAYLGRRQQRDERRRLGAVHVPRTGARRGG